PPSLHERGHPLQVRRPNGEAPGLRLGVGSVTCDDRVPHPPPPPVERRPHGVDASAGGGVGSGSNAPSSASHWTEPSAPSRICIRPSSVATKTRPRASTPPTARGRDAAWFVRRRLEIPPGDVHP